MQKPSVSLLANGVELGKGTEELQETMKILQTNKNLHFIGNVEPEHVIAGEIEEGTNGHAGDINVVATDGHTGNIFLKMYQAAPKGFLEFSKQELKRRSLLHPKTWIQIVSAKAVSGLFRETRRKLKDRVGAAMLVGVKAPVFKIHGSSTPEEFASGIVGTHQMLKNARETGILQQLYGNGDHRNEKVAM